MKPMKYFILLVTILPMNMTIMYIKGSTPNVFSFFICLFLFIYLIFLGRWGIRQKSHFLETSFFCDVGSYPPLLPVFPVLLFPKPLRGRVPILLHLELLIANFFYNIYIYNFVQISRYANLMLINENDCLPMVVAVLYETNH